ncbi:MAG TPA: hypothetical protein DDZ51_02785 [Planctomycetaceae bacterium]|nr:hypothetical protein [Planctomycetaceae bacterium]
MLASVGIDAAMWRDMVWHSKKVLWSFGVPRFAIGHGRGCQEICQALAPRTARGLYLAAKLNHAASRAMPANYPSYSSVSHRFGDRTV